MLDWKNKRAAKLLKHDPVPLGVILHIADVFGLCQSEARVIALLADGYTLPEIGKMAGFTISSIRTYIKQAQLKTDTHTQVQLVRLVYRATMDIAA